MRRTAETYWGKPHPCGFRGSASGALPGGR
ncbi:hypothetical protein MBT84_18435 [Streptomyces sp. MBT84]|nr:hypothetical protein [Streptomyces sp. MBT84]REE62674.1 hypothetical protein BX257_5300 [Streptomyces sp. 3212.3]